MPNGTDGAIMKWIRANPLKTITFIFVAISSMITTAWAIEVRYNNRPQIYQVSQDSLEGRIQNYEDTIFRKKNFSVSSDTRILSSQINPLTT